ncbi:MAG TPA: phosphomannomutase/phosphoglucomutase [Candidatus Woesebacteria bacterium]|nr:phosphomannomutase/phosphoglucomutase [Candidatus Woesebacteria bacterium]
MTTIDPSIFKAYDIRATYPDKLNEDVIEDVIRAIYTYFTQLKKKEHMTIVLGHDMRTHSLSLFQRAKNTLIQSGAHVIDVGLVPTPTVYFTTLQYQYDAGIMISASHNPKEYNGVKMALRDGTKMVKIGKTTGMLEIKEIAMNKKFPEYTNDGTVEEKKDVLKEEIAQAYKAIHPGDVSNLKIVADPANAMGILPLKELFDGTQYERVKTTFIPINFELDGTFPAHQADPLQHKTLRQLQDTVIEEKADLGICTDGDADRVMFINEKGQIIPATYITALVASEILKDFPGERILVDIRYTRNVEHVVKQLGGEVGYTKVGHALITEQINKENAVFAGESSGHYYFRETGGCESTMRIILYVLRVLGREKRPISEILQEMEVSYESGEYNFELPEGVTAQTITEQITSAYRDGTLSTLDGIAIDYPDWRLSIRTSNTEPLLRLNIEGKTKELVMAKVAELRHEIESTGAHIIE